MWCRFLHNAVASPTTELWPHRADHLEAGWNVFQRFRDILSQPTQRATVTIWTGGLFWLHLWDIPGKSLGRGATGDAAGADAPPALRIVHVAIFLIGPIVELELLEEFLKRYGNRIEDTVLLSVVSTRSSTRWNGTAPMRSSFLLRNFSSAVLASLGPLNSSSIRLNGYLRSLT
jgi:hypothetical protein